MKKMISMMIVGVLGVLLVGCGSTEKNPAEGNTASDNVQTQAPATDNEVPEDTPAATASADSGLGDNGVHDSAAGNNDTAGNDTAVDDTAGDGTVQDSTGQGDRQIQDNDKAVSSLPQGDSRKKNSGLISKKKAKQAAIKDAGVSEKDISGLRIHLETDDRVQHYEVEFDAGSHEYDYEIDAITGGVRSKDVDMRDDGRSGSNGKTGISKEKAIKIVLKKVPGAARKNVRIKLDRENGKKVYEGSVIYKKIEYEFEIDAANGNLLGWDKESIYD